MSNGKIMGLDFGQKRIGIAFSDFLGILSTGYENYSRLSLEEDLQHLQDLIKSNSVKKVVVGYPYNMDGTKSDTGNQIEEFMVNLIEKVQVEVVYVDERLTSLEAEERLQRYPWQVRKKMLDKVSAEIILQNYLDEKGE